MTAPASSGCKEGRIGKVTHAYLCSNRPGAVEDYRLKGPRPAIGQEPPASLNWDLWLGTAPVRPYAPDIYHPTKWRAWQDFGTGWSGDIGCHIFDPVWKGLGLQAPLTVSAEVQESWKNSPARRGDTWPQGDHIIWTFPGNEKIGGGELVLEWFDGEYYPPERIRKLYSEDLKEYPPESSMLIGTEGSLLIPHDGPPQLLPEEKFSSVPAAQAPAAQPLPSFRGRVPGRGEDRVPLRADRPDGRGHPARHRGHPRAGPKAGVGQRPHESHQQRRGQPLSPTQVPRRLAAGTILANERVTWVAWFAWLHRPCNSGWRSRLM